MPNAAATAELPYEAQVELAGMGDGLKRWARLRLLLKAAPTDSGDAGDRLNELLDAARPKADAHAGSLAAFYRRNGSAVNGMIAATTADDGTEGALSPARKKFAELGDDPAATLTAQAEGFVSGGVTEANDGLCSALLNLMLESYVCCFAGVEGSCGTMWSDLYERHC